MPFILIFFSLSNPIITSGFIELPKCLSFGVIGSVIQKGLFFIVYPPRAAITFEESKLKFP
jgi:hypothetical protein